MMGGRGLTVDHVTIFRWVQRYAPEINKRIRPHLKMSGTSYRLGWTVETRRGRPGSSRVCSVSPLNESYRVPLPASK